MQERGSTDRQTLRQIEIPEAVSTRVERVRLGNHRARTGPRKDSRIGQYCDKCLISY